MLKSGFYLGQFSDGKILAATLELFQYNSKYKVNVEYYAITPVYMHDEGYSKLFQDYVSKCDVVKDIDGEECLNIDYESIFKLWSEPINVNGLTVFLKEESISDEFCEEDLKLIIDKQLIKKLKLVDRRVIGVDIYENILSECSDLCKTNSVLQCLV